MASQLGADCAAADAAQGPRLQRTPRPPPRDSQGAAADQDAPRRRMLQRLAVIRPGLLRLRDALLAMLGEVEQEAREEQEWEVTLRSEFEARPQSTSRGVGRFY